MVMIEVKLYVIHNLEERVLIQNQPHIRIFLLLRLIWRKKKKTNVVAPCIINSWFRIWAEFSWLNTNTPPSTDLGYISFSGFVQKSHFPSRPVLPVFAQQSPQICHRPPNWLAHSNFWKWQSLLPPPICSVDHPRPITKWKIFAAWLIAHSSANGAEKNIVTRWLNRFNILIIRTIHTSIITPLSENFNSSPYIRFSWNWDILPTRLVPIGIIIAAMLFGETSREWGTAIGEGGEDENEDTIVENV